MAAPDPFAGLPDELFDPALHWGLSPAPAGRTYTGERVASYAAGGEGVFSKRNGEKALVGIVDAKRVVACLRYALGYNNTDGPTFVLKRTNPICHPKYTGLICTAASEREFLPRRRNPPVGSTNSGLKLARGDSGILIPANKNSGGSPLTFPYYAGYEKAEVLLRFAPPAYPLRDDAFISRSPGFGEYQRNTVIDTEPRVDVLTLSGFTMKYAEGTGNTAPVSNPQGQDFPTDIGQILVKTDVKVSWFDVPEKFLFNSPAGTSERFPAKILRGLGTVNQFDWAGFKKGTLLVSAARLVRHPWTLACTVSAGLNDESQYSYDVEFLFTYFNPVKGFTSNVQITDADRFGWNNFPFRGVVDATPDKNAGRWFFATFNGTVSAGFRTLYEYTSISNLFDDVRNPDITTW